MLSLENVHAYYGESPALHGVTLNAHDGEIVAVLGRNGAGKTTTMRAIMGLLECRKGRIVFGDKEITAIPAHKRARLGFGYVPQGREIFPRLTVLENLKLGALNASNLSDGQFAEVYRYFPMLKERSRQRAGTLSGGEQQQLAVGRALLVGRKVILLDEPTAGVQPNVVELLRERLLQMNKEKGVTIVLVEQNLDFAAKCASRFYIMEKGKIVEEISDVSALSLHKVVRRYLAV